jgi:uncharacterized membrane protein
MKPAQLLPIGLGLIFLGFLVVAVGTFSGINGSTSAGGFVLIGPFPIVFGSGPDSAFLVSAALAVSIAVVGVYLASFLLWRSGRRREEEKEPESGG